MTARNNPACSRVVRGQNTKGAYHMNKFAMSAAGAAMLVAGAMAVPAEAKGCIKGAAVGGVGGHMAGHHGLAGAAAGCAVGHHMAHKKEKKDSNPSG